MAIDDAHDSAEKMDNRRSQRLTARKRLAGMIESELSRPKLSKARKETEQVYGGPRARADLSRATINETWNNGSNNYGLERMGAMDSVKMSAQNDLAGLGFPTSSPLIPSVPELLRSLSDSPISTSSSFPSLAASMGPFSGLASNGGLTDASLTNTTSPSLSSLFLYSGDPLSLLRPVSLPSSSTTLPFPFFTPTHAGALTALYGVNDTSSSANTSLTSGKFSELNTPLFTPSQAERILSLMPSLSSVHGPTTSLPMPENGDSKLTHGTRFLPTFSPTFPHPRDIHEETHSQTSSSAPGTPRSTDDDSSTTIHDSLCSPSRLSPISASMVAPHHGPGLPVSFGMHSHYPATSEATGTSSLSKFSTTTNAAPSSPLANASSAVTISSPNESHSSPALQPGCGRYAEYIHDLKTVCAQCAASGRLKSRKKPLVDSLILLAYFGDGIKRDPHGLEYIIEDSNVARELMNIISSNIRPPSRGTNNSYDNWKRAMGKSFRKCGHSFTPKDEETAKYARHVEEHIARIHQRSNRRQNLSGE